MLFNSFEYALFLSLVFCIYWFILNKNIRVQNGFLLVTGYFFYGWWDWRFLFLLCLSSTVDFFVGISLEKSGTQRIRKVVLLFSVLFNITLLGFFKYFNFFAASLTVLFTKLGFQVHPITLSVILPVGISFYTFQSLSYTIDVYRRVIKPTRDPLTFFAFVSFFPQLVAGPIERAKNLIPQFSTIRVFNYNAAVDGLRQILWGLFKKIVIADNCAEIINPIFTNYQDYSGSTLCMAAFLFSFQIYCDFSGYSDIAIGTARLFGFNLMQNFAFPYFSRDIAEFWRRWHISLTTWFRDYVYIPLGGSRVNTVKKLRNVFIVFIVSGLWHGANWTFIVWGAFHALCFIPLLVSGLNRKNIRTINHKLPQLREFVSMSITFTLVAIGWIFFRSATISDALSYLLSIGSKSLFTIPQIIPYKVFLPLLILLVVEWLQRNKPHGLHFTGSTTPKIIRLVFYNLIIFLIVLLSSKPQTFIYFQF